MNGNGNLEGNLILEYSCFLVYIEDIFEREIQTRDKFIHSIGEVFQDKLRTTSLFEQFHTTRFTFFSFIILMFYKYL